MKKPFRIAVIDDHPVVCTGLEQILGDEPDLEVCATARDRESALALLDTKSPDLMIIDLMLGESNGIELLQTIRSDHPQLPVLIFSMYDERIYAERALRAGANGYIMKADLARNIVLAVRRILSGAIYVSEGVSGEFIQKYLRDETRSSAHSIESLTPRELEVFQLIGEGCGTPEIAGRMRISVKTVDRYKELLKDKLSAQSARDLLKLAIIHNRLQT